MMMRLGVPGVRDPTDRGGRGRGRHLRVEVGASRERDHGGGDGCEQTCGNEVTAA
jgi:hypothetical protein